MDKKLYIVTVYKKEDLDGLYDDLETEGGSEFVPERAVECSLRRPLSRNTHYYLTDLEAESLKKDPRVWDVQLPPEELGLKFEPTGYAVTQTSTFDKNGLANSDSVNWALYRNFQETHDATWAVDATKTKTETIQYNLTGRNVDIVVIDETIDVEHPDFAVNPDGTGGSRVQQLNWFSYNSQVTGLGDLDGQTLPTGTYNYIQSSDDDHGTPVASCAAGSRHGMAKSANIYNINYDQPRRGVFTANTAGSVLTVTYVYPGSDPIAVGQRVKGPGITTTRTISSFGTGTGGVGTYNLSGSVSTNYTGREFTTHYAGVWDFLIWDYIRAFHRKKPVNTETGRRNPTICNASFALYAYPPLASISSIVYRGTTYTSSTYSPWTLAGIYSAFGVPNYYNSTAIVIANYTAYEADLADAIEDGVFVVNAAGNENCKIANSADIDYNNRLVYSGTTYYYHRGGIFGSNPNVFMVGSCSPTAANYKSTFSSSGPRIDVFAPGENIACASDFTKEFFSINRWSVTSNVATFRITDADAEKDYLIGLIGFQVEIGMASTTALDGIYTVQSVAFEPLKIYPTLFTVNLTYPDTANTTEEGYVIGQYTTAGLYPKDTRAPYKFMASVDGTSFAAPNAAGVIACLMEVYPRMDYYTALGLVQDKAAFGNIADSGIGDYSNELALRGALNVTLGYESDPLYYQFPDERQTTGLVYPKTNYKSRFDIFYRSPSATLFQFFPRVSNLR